jgi:hypothetical protein
MLGIEGSCTRSRIVMSRRVRNWPTACVPGSSAVSSRAVAAVKRYRLTHVSEMDGYFSGSGDAKDQLALVTALAESIGVGGLEQPIEPDLGRANGAAVT